MPAKQINNTLKRLNTIFICALLLLGLLSCKKEKAEEWF
jgi:hypothetical protein